MKKSHTQLVALVKKEANSLKKKATKEELQKLNFQRLRPLNGSMCIYGQMTGDCYTPRAHSLILSCTTKSYVQPTGTLQNAELNGKMDIYLEQGFGRNHYSPIEAFIAKPENMSNGNNEILIDYLKGKRKTLTFKSF